MHTFRGTKCFIEDVDGDYIDMSHSLGPTGISTSSCITRSKSRLTNVIILPASNQQSLIWRTKVFPNELIGFYILLYHISNIPSMLLHVCSTRCCNTTCCSVVSWLVCIFKSHRHQQRAVQPVLYGLREHQGCIPTVLPTVDHAI